MTSQKSLAQLLDRATSNARTSVPWAGRFVKSGSRLRAGLVEDIHWPPAPPGPGGRSAKLARVEAILFAATEPISSRRLALAAGLADAAQARALVKELQSYYDVDATAFTVEYLAGGWQLRTRRELAPWLDKLQEQDHGLRLSHPALETLAIVAYRQPILRADLEAIRGVASGEMLRQLIDRGLVRIAGHHDSLGRPLLYATTRRFMEVFGLSSLDQLPMVEELRLPSAHPAKTEANGLDEQAEPAT